MNRQKRLRDYGVRIGRLETGVKNRITDVSGVRVGHCTIAHEGAQTGVTAVVPHQGNTFQEKVIASSHVLNGFGKTLGTVQLNELGTLETPILLTNTLSVGTVTKGLIEYILEHNHDIGETTGTVNPVVGECNDMLINSIRNASVSKEDVLEAIEESSTQFEEGAVGAGRGMVCYGLKGGIGSSSRLIHLDHDTYTIGVLVLANFGQMEDLMINGSRVGQSLKEKMDQNDEPDRGSIMMIVATDLPVTERQLNRMIKRTSTGLARTGSTISHGSGDIAIGFSTATKIPHYKPTTLLSIPSVHEEDLNAAFRAVGEATEEAILNALVTAESVPLRDGRIAMSLIEAIEEHGLSLT
ncbi:MULTISPECIES: P1 family peptidase [Pontibacillus]|uniref:P1 family peptidase n=1 Tax=Pontibacillus chungwhensis TaxID=265426 RepID=A0ABY8UYJ7_9BACI|nr:MULTISPECIES: P1 family peptidase [Pontibacillus]MCD5325676.1 P1 family peptidase [Pontibacillus sp. HN14]WIF98082.1 P1 family peptidase [Pontibacillus chungwhensis]